MEIKTKKLLAKRKTKIMACGHYKCHFVWVIYSCNIRCGSPHSTGWCEMCELENKIKKPEDFGCEIKRKHPMSEKKPQGYSRQEELAKKCKEIRNIK